MDALLGLQIWTPRWGYKYGRPAGATNMDALLGLYDKRFLHPTLTPKTP